MQIFFILIALLLLFSCNMKTERDEATFECNNETFTELLSGAWEVTCEDSGGSVYTQATYIINSDGSFAFNYALYPDDTCTGVPTKQLASTGNWESGVAVTDDLSFGTCASPVNFTVRTLNFAVGTVLVAGANSGSLCGATDWVAGSFKSVFACNLTSVGFGTMLAVDEIIYSFYSVDRSDDPLLLYWDGETTAWNPLTAETQPIDVLDTAGTVSQRAAD